MERVALILDDSGERISCLLNPSSLVVQRRAGVRSRRATSGLLTAAGLADDPLLFTGGGTTELQLDLLFDVTLSGSTQQTSDVRELTGPLWRLAENQPEADGYGSPARVRFVWGKAWNIPGVIIAVAERLEQFTAGGVPRRSWLRMRLRRVGEAPLRATPQAKPPPALGLSTPGEIPDELVEVHDVAGPSRTSEIEGETEEPQGGEERLDQIAFGTYGNPAMWRVIAEFNQIVDPLKLIPGMRLLLPPAALLKRKP